MTQSSSKKVITKEEWEKKLSEVKIRKEDMNRLVMNFLVTEGYVEAAEKFQRESGTQRILSRFSQILSLPTQWQWSVVSELFFLVLGLLLTVVPDILMTSSFVVRMLLVGNLSIGGTTDLSTLTNVL